MLTTLNCRGHLLSLSRPVVVGILNVTPDSFYDGGKYTNKDAILIQAEKMTTEGAAIIDVGGASSRPGAVEVSEPEEWSRVVQAIEVIRGNFPEVLISVDTWRAGVAQAALDAGAHLVNDISAGRMDAGMYPTVAQSGAPYVLMHMQGTPGTMQQSPYYEDVVTEVLDFFIAEIKKLRDLGVTDIVLDPGFGFGKTLEHNYTLLRNLHVFRNVTGLPVLAGLSRKSMVYKLLGLSPEEALSGTSALHIVALQQGASILRAHDVRAAVEVIRLWEMLGDPATFRKF